MQSTPKEPFCLLLGAKGVSSNRIRGEIWPLIISFAGHQKYRRMTEKELYTNWHDLMIQRWFVVEIFIKRSKRTQWMHQELQRPRLHHTTQLDREKIWKKSVVLWLHDDDPPVSGGLRAGSEPEVITLSWIALIRCNAGKRIEVVVIVPLLLFDSPHGDSCDDASHRESDADYSEI